MLKLSELKAKMDESLAKQEGYLAKVSEAIEADKADEAEQAKALHTEEIEAFETLKEQFETAKKHQEMISIKDEVAKMAEPKGDVNTPSSPAEAKDHDVEKREQWGAFYDWFRGKRVEGKRADMLRPKSKKLQELESADTISAVMPESLAVKVMGPTYAQVFGKTMYSVANPASGSNPSAAQNLVPPDFRAQLLQLPFDQPSLYDRVTVIASSTGTVTWPVLVQTAADEFGVSFSWIGEGAEKPETEPEFEQKEIATHELAGYTEISERLLSRSAINLENVLATLFRGSMAYAIDNVIINGTGSAQPTGIVNTTGINTVGRNTAGTVVDQDLVNLKHAVKSVHRAGASFALDDTVEQQLELAYDTLGRPLFRASTANGPYDRLAGYPYLIASNCPAVGTSGDIIFGNFKYYYLVMEEEITIARSAHAKFRENKIAYKVFAVVGGRLLQPRALSILGAVGS